MREKLFTVLELVARKPFFFQARLLQRAGPTLDGETLQQYPII